MTRILICDDDRDMVLMPARVLEKEGYEVRIETESTQIVEKVIEYKPAVILMDLWMPEVDGEQAIRKLRRHKDTQHIPVILFSAIPRLEEIAIRLKVPYLSKPFQVAELKTLLKESLETTDQE